jgi:lipopolysaccharide transport system ATP-binding protein
MANRAFLLHAGSIVAQGSVDDVISTYLSKSARQLSYVCDEQKQHSDSPHVERIDIHTSDPNGVQRYGKPLEIRFLIHHDKPMSRACFSFQIINQYQHPVIHAFAFHPMVTFGTHPGESLLVCRFPFLRLNVGRFYLKTFLSEPPGGELYETLDGLCQIDVVRTEDSVLWGWRPDACAYHEEWQFNSISVQPGENEWHLIQA